MFLCLALPALLHAQAINDVFDEVGDETYKGGFGSFNWVDASSFGFTANNAGVEAFLSNYTGFPLPDIGFVKPLNGIIANTTYRVSFYCSRYSSANTPAFTDYDTLYIGTPNGTMQWDTVPTPVDDTVWVRWSGTFTPAPGDIGQPFAFGCSLPQLISGTSLAYDGPFHAIDISTGIVQLLDAPRPLTMVRSGNRVQVNGVCGPVKALRLFDAVGHELAVRSEPSGTGVVLDMSGQAPGSYALLVECDGQALTGRFLLR